MRIFVTGTRGIPDIQGGVETHCEQLFPRIAAMGHEVILARRTPYVAKTPGLKQYKGVALVDIFAPKRKSIEAIVHTTLAIIRAKKMKADVLHVHAIGPAIMVPLARLLGLKVVMTNHGPDYDRQKWGRLAKFVLRTGENMGTRFSNDVIVISETIRRNLANLYGRTDTHLIFNGVERPAPCPATDFVESLGCKPGRYILTLGRFVPEKGFHDLIAAYKKSGLHEQGVNLVIAGDADHEDKYSRELKELGATTPGVKMPGFLKGEPLHQLLSHAGRFVLPSYHEGLPISLLEAMSYGLEAFVSDIPANRIPAMKEENIFAPGDVDALSAFLARPLPTAPTTYDLTPYDWDNIARQTNEIYLSLAKK